MPLYLTIKLGLNTNAPQVPALIACVLAIGWIQNIFAMKHILEIYQMKKTI